nr:MAG TPA: hypothetical protein [Ackermannviridae sp.]
MILRRIIIDNWIYHYKSNFKEVINSISFFYIRS